MGAKVRKAGDDHAELFIFCLPPRFLQCMCTRSFAGRVCKPCFLQWMHTLGAMPLSGSLDAALRCEIGAFCSACMPTRELMDFVATLLSTCVRARSLACGAGITVS